MAKKMIAGLIYKAKRGCIYDTDGIGRKYNCYIPCDYVQPENSIGDCWVCDSQGNVHPGYNNCGVPVSRESLGEVIGKVES